jgi:cephalosporin-C deacetylase
MAQFDLPLETLRGYHSETPEPDGFDEHWSSTLAAARQHDVILERRPVETGLVASNTWDVRFAGFDGHPIAAWYTEPLQPKAHGGVVVEYLGYGRGRGLPHERLLWSAAGYAHLLMDSRGQGGQHGNGGDTTDPAGTPPSAAGFVTRGIDDPLEHYYRRLVTDAVRAVDAARALGDADAPVVVAGNSQGGGLALAAGGLVPDVSAVLANVPFLAHPRRALMITESSPWSEVVHYLSVHRDQVDAAMRTLDFVDGVNFARRGLAPLHAGVALRDTICPPSTVFAAFNAWGEHAETAVRRDIEVYPFNHHEGGDAVHSRSQLDWLARVLERA